MRRGLVFVLAGFCLMIVALSAQAYAQIQGDTTSSSGTAANGTVSSQSPGTAYPGGQTQGSATTQQTSGGYSTAATNSITTGSHTDTNTTSSTVQKGHKAPSTTSDPGTSGSANTQTSSVVTDKQTYVQSTTQYPTAQQPAPTHNPVTTQISSGVYQTSGNAPAVAPNTSATRLLDTTVSPLGPNTPVIKPKSGATQAPRKRETQVSQLENVGTSLRALQKAVRSVDTDVQTAVTFEVNKALNQASEAPAPSVRLAQPSVRTFDPNEREAQLLQLKAAVNERQEKLSRDVQTTLTSGAPNDNRIAELGPVLKSSLGDIELLINYETGAQIDLSPTARNIVTDVTEKAQEFQTVRQAFLERDGLDLYTDSDRDGISDYDEAHIYRTDPRNAYSGGGSLTDGEKVLLGFDVSMSSLRRVAVESPVASGEETKEMFEVYSIAINKRLLPDDTTSADASVQGTSATEVGTSSGKLPAFKDSVTFTGRGLPNSFITLYIFSTPIVVTVKTDVSGAWIYTLDSELPDGEHKLYVATVDAGGKILAKSPAVPFVKTAEAADFTPLLISETPDTDPLEVLRNNLIIIVGALVAIFGVAALMMLGAWKARPPEDPAVA